MDWRSIWSGRTVALSAIAVGIRPPSVQGGSIANPPAHREMAEPRFFMIASNHYLHYANRRPSARSKFRAELREEEGKCHDGLVVGHKLISFIFE